MTVTSSPEWADSCGQGPVSVQIGLGLSVLEVENEAALPSPRVSASPEYENPRELYFFFNENYMKYNCFRNSLLPETLFNIRN